MDRMEIWYEEMDSLIQDRIHLATKVHRVTYQEIAIFILLL
jgi:hypothetical protein